MAQPDAVPANATTLTQTTLVHQPSAEPGPWWRSAVIYQVYPRSFRDASGDGIGDLAGVAAQLGYLASLGVDAVWLSPIYVSPQADAGYDVADHCDVDPVFGTLSDFDSLLQQAHIQGLRVIMDLVPNHTSASHPWFVEALASAPGSSQRSRYIFRDGRGPAGAQPPNDWMSTFGGPAWTRVIEADGTPGQWYLHLFDTAQPDLNWDNEGVRAAIDAVLRFWLDRGVDGFRVDVAHGMVKQADLPDLHGAPTKVVAAAARGIAGAGDIGPMWDQEGVHEIIARWRRVLDAYPGDRCLIAEAWVEPLDRLARYLRADEMSLAFNFAYLFTAWDANALRTVIDTSLRAFDAVDAPGCWALNNHDTIRTVTRLAPPCGGDPATSRPDDVTGTRRARAAFLVQAALPGALGLYQGEELGLPEVLDIPDAERADPVFRRTGGAQPGRDGCRVPLPWQAGAPAYGFSPTGQSWLTQPPAFQDLAADLQRGDADSTLELYRSALHLRRQHRLGTGSLAWVDAASGPADPGIVAFANRRVLVIANTSPEPVTLPPGMDVLLASNAVGRDETGGAVLPPDTAIWVRTAV